MSRMSSSGKRGRDPPFWYLTINAGKLRPLHPDDNAVPTGPNQKLHELMREINTGVALKSDVETFIYHKLCLLQHHHGSTGINFLPQSISTSKSRTGNEVIYLNYRHRNDDVRRVQEMVMDEMKFVLLREDIRIITMPQHDANLWQNRATVLQTGDASQLRKRLKCLYDQWYNSQKPASSPEQSPTKQLSSAQPPSSTTWFEELLDMKDANVCEFSEK